MHNNIQDDLFEIKETDCESCKFNILGCKYCSQYEDTKPAKVMTGKERCVKYVAHQNQVMAGIVGFAVGDALGVPVEFMSREELQQNPVDHMREYGSHNQPRGTWSDDTSLTLALIKGLREKEFSLDSIAKKACNWFQHAKYTPAGVVFDVGNATQKAIDQMLKGVSPEDAGGKTEFDNGNGSLMRILPMAFYLKDQQYMEERKRLVYLVSSFTHGHIRSKAACHILVELAIKMINGDTFEQAYQFITDVLSSYYKEQLPEAEVTKFTRIFSGELYQTEEKNIKSSGYVIDTLEAVIWCLIQTDSYKAAVLKAVNLGDDTDTIGAITGGLAGIMYGYESIPANWRNQLVNEIMVNNAAMQLYKKCYRESNVKLLEEHFIKDYNLKSKQAVDAINYLKEYTDIYEEYLYYERTKSFPRENAVSVAGLSAEDLYKSTYLGPVGAYNYLIYLRHDPKTALDKLKKGLPRK